MRIGDLRHRITLQSATQTSDGMGGFNIVWKNEMTVWGSMWPTSASEIVAANSISMIVSHRIRIRYRLIESSWRIKHGDKYYAIVSIINPNMANRQLDLMVKEAA